MGKKITVVGGGIAGLASALRLQADGYDVTIYEKLDRLGGKMNQIKGKGFTFDLGPTIVMMPHIYRELLEYTGVKMEDYITFNPVDPMYKITFQDGEAMDATSDLNKLTYDLEARGHGVAEGYLKYLSGTYKKYNIAKTHFLERTFRSWRDFYNPKTLWNALRLRTLGTAQKAIEKYIKDEKIQNMVSFQTLYIGVSPYSGPSIYTIIPMIQTMYGVHYSKGGMYAYVEAVEKRFKELGGKVKLNSKVEEVLFEGKTATGILLNGEAIQSDAVVVNADFPRAMHSLIKSPKVRGKYTDQKLKKMKYSCSVFLMYLGLDKKVPDLRVHNLYFGGDFKQNLDEIFSGKLPEDPAYYMYSPSQIDDSVAPEGHEGIYVLVPVPELKTAQFEWTDEVKNAFKEKIMKKMMKEKGLEDLRDHIVFEEMFTPDLFSSELEAHYGATFGLAPTLDQSIYFRPRNVHPYGKKLYFAGSSVHPGAGIPIAITSGNLVHQEVKKDVPL